MAKAITTAMTLLCALTLCVGVAAAQDSAPALTKSVTLKAAGGATFSAPEWTVTKSTDAAVVLEQAPEPARAIPFHIMMFSVEKGPKPGDPIDWDTIRDNIKKSAQEAGRTLELGLGDKFKDAEGFEARIMSGRYRDPSGSIGFELISLIKDARMVTVALVSKDPNDKTRALLVEVAKKVRVTAAPE